ncbi:hypothetical protein [Acidisphaera sp. S103]|uniref:hypothetical protein n=1 Tax=Acidisphaera sp. S103 TaxID=1747223 RepID=UPI00131C05BB|nr:hypothetical protein [Acidisphaera sp. S103]
MAGVQVIRILGGFREGYQDHATVVGETLTCGDAEPFPAFQARAVAAAKAAGEAFVVIGGFPVRSL